MSKTNEIEVVENVAETAAQSGLTRNQKVGIIVGATVLTGGLAYLGYRLFKHLKARRAANANANPEPVSEPVQE